MTTRSFPLVTLLLSLYVVTSAHAFTHPCIPNTREELDAIKAKLNQQPWKQGYAVLAGDGHSQLDYVMRGPFESTSRNPYLNLNEWRSDMVAVHNLAKMWYFTGNEAYAQKARDILIAWAETHTNFGGWEAGLDLGDFAPAYAGGASILRGTWPGWTAADTATVKDYFQNVLWPASLAGYNVPGPANKGSLYMAAGIAIAVFCDDTAKFNHVINLYRTAHSAGLPNTLPTGEMGETGRDAGHGYADLKSKVFVAEVAWKQGIDLYSEMDNRLLACGEYYCRNTFTSDTPFVPFGTIDYHYWVNADGPYTANRAALYMLQNAYKNRKNLPTPWIDRKLEEQHVDGDNWMYAKSADFTTAAPPAAISFPAVSLASGGLTLTTLGTQTVGRSASYANGVWTVTGLGNNVWSDSVDDCQFAYRQMTGDCAMVARLTSSQFPGSEAKAGLMIRDNLTATVSKRGWVGIRPEATDIRFESYMSGWTENWGGSNWAKRSQPLPPGMPYWLKIERRGNMVTTFASQDGTSWAAVCNSYYANLPSTLYIGLFITSGSTTANTTTFDNVAFTGGTGGLVTAPTAPAAVFASGSSKAITVRWLPSFGATSYRLLRSTNPNSGWATLADNLSTDKTSYVDTSVVAGTTYYYAARAINSAGSGTSPAFGASLLPAPMVNLAFSGTATASFNGDSDLEGAHKAFDRDPGSKWFGWNAPTGWLQYDFGVNNAQVVKRYTINSADVLERDPKSWNFLGSQDGSNWITLDSQSDQSFRIRMGMNTYDIGNTTAYRYYRLEITANHGAGGVAVAELGLWSDTGRTIPDGTYGVVNRKSNKVMDVYGAGTTDGTKIIQWPYHGGNNQRWTFTHVGNGQYQASGVASGKVLDVAGMSNADGAQVHIWSWLNTANQKWTVTPAGDGYFKLLNVNSSKAADVSGGSTANGADVIQSSYTGDDNQQWLVAFSPAYVAGEVVQAIDLNGTDDYVTLPSGLANLTDCTFATWVNWDGGSQWQRIFDFGNDTTSYLFLTPRSGSNTLRFAITTSSVSGEQIVETSQLSIGQWVHVAVTLSGDTATLYVNGSAVASNTGVTIDPSDFAPVNNYIGKSQWPDDPLFDGRVDEFHIYDHALTASQIVVLAGM